MAVGGLPDALGQFFVARVEAARQLLRDAVVEGIRGEERERHGAKLHETSEEVDQRADMTCEPSSESRYLL